MSALQTNFTGHCPWGSVGSSRRIVFSCFMMLWTKKWLNLFPLSFASVLCYSSAKCDWQSSKLNEKCKHINWSRFSARWKYDFFVRFKQIKKCKKHMLNDFIRFTRTYVFIFYFLWHRKIQIILVWYMDRTKVSADFIFIFHIVNAIFKMLQWHLFINTRVYFVLQYFLNHFISWQFIVRLHRKR